MRTIATLIATAAIGLGAGGAATAGPASYLANADASALTAGANVVVRGFKLPNGSVSAGFVSVGKDGSVPPG